MIMIGIGIGIGKQNQELSQELPLLPSVGRDAGCHLGSALIKVAFDVPGECMCMARARRRTVSGRSLSGDSNMDEQDTQDKILGAKPIL